MSGLAGLAIASANSSRPLPLANGFGSPSESIERNRPRRLFAEILGTAANLNLQVGRLVGIGDAVQIGILRRKRCLQALDFGDQAVDVLAAVSFEEADHLAFHLGILIDFAEVEQAQRRTVREIGPGTREVEVFPQDRLGDFERALLRIEIPLLANHRERERLERIRFLPQLFVGSLPPHQIVPAP